MQQKTSTGERRHPRISQTAVVKTREMEFDVLGVVGGKLASQKLEKMWLEKPSCQ